MIKVRNRIDVSFSNLREINPMLSTATVRILYPGLNRNGTYFDKKFIEEELVQTLYGTPLVGEYFKSKEDYGDHGGDIVISDGIEYVYTTQPYGFVPLFTDIWWEDVKEADGKVREYLTTNVIVWTGRFKEAKSIVKDGKGHSMELDPDTMVVEWVKEGNKKYANVVSAMFSGLCVLGDDVEPCFESSGVGPSKYTSNPNYVKAENELNQVVKNLDIEKVQNLWAHSIKSEGSERHIIVEGVNAFSKASKSTEKEEGGSNQMVYNKFAFGMSHGEVRETIFNALNPYNPEEGYTFNYSIGPVYDDYVVVYKYEDNEYYGMKYQKVDEKIVPGIMYHLNHEFITDEEKKAVGEARDARAAEYTALEEKVVKVEENFELVTKEKEEIETKYSAAAEEVVELKKSAEQYSQEKEAELKELVTLREFKAEIDKNKKMELIKEFSVLGEETLEDFKTKVDEYSYSELKSKLSVIAFENKVNFSLNTGDSSGNEGEDEGAEPGEGKNNTTYSAANNFDNGKPGFLKAIDARKNK